MATITVTKKQGAGITGLAAAIIAAVFAVEGGYSNDPKDPGGETNHGITKEVAVQNGYLGSMKELPKEFAEKVYYQDYVVKPGFEPVIQISFTVAHKLIDAGVNTGVSRPSRWFQTSLNALNRGGKDYSSILVDGKVGPGTVAAYQALQKVRGKQLACELMIKTLDAQQATYYMSLTNLNTYTVGWISNRIGNIPISGCKDD